MPLTERQELFFALLVRYVGQYNRSPMLDELKEWLEANNWGEIRSLNSITQYLDALEKSGKIIREGRKRGIRILDKPEVASIPLINSIVSCGSPQNLLEEEVAEYHSISRKIANRPDRMFLFKCEGDSMNKAEIEDGDLLLIEVTPNIEDKDIVLANVDDCGTIKRFRSSKGAFSLFPESTNPMHRPIHLHESDRFRILGKVRFTFKNTTNS